MGLKNGKRRGGTSYEEDVSAQEELMDQRGGVRIVSNPGGKPTKGAETTERGAQNKHHSRGSC